MATDSNRLPPFRGYRDGYIAGHAAAYPTLRVRWADYADYTEPPTVAPGTPEGRYRTEFQAGWLDGYQDGRAIIRYMYRMMWGADSTHPSIDPPLNPDRHVIIRNTANRIIGSTTDLTEDAG